MPPKRFIPFRRDDIVKMCLAGDELDSAAKRQFEKAAVFIEGYFHDDFHVIKQSLKRVYAPLDPDADTRELPQYASEDSSESLATELETVLNRANYERVSAQALKLAFSTESLFKIRLHVDLDDFEEVLLYTRGGKQRSHQLDGFFGLFKKQVDFVNFERVVLYVKFKDQIDTSEALASCQPGSIMLKLFQNVPAADLEMLFPNTRVGMRLLDKLMIAVPAAISGGIVLTTKLGTTLLLIGSLVGFWVGTHSEPVDLNRAAVLAVLAGLGAFLGYVWKQVSSFRNRKLKYTQALTENLYFKLLDNNAGVLFRLLDEAEESECKESLVAYFGLLSQRAPMTATALDQGVEQWFQNHWQCSVDFEIADALAKLEMLGLATCTEGLWQAVDFPPTDAAALA